MLELMAGIKKCSAQAVLRADIKPQCIMTSVPFAQLDFMWLFLAWFLPVPSLFGSLSVGRTYTELKVRILRHGMHN